MLPKLNHIPVHFILCTERSGSSLLSLMLNLHPQIISPSEEPFAVFFYKKYKNKTVWTAEEIKLFIEEFWLMSEKDLNLFFTTKENVFNCLVQYKDQLSYQNLIKLIYLNFLEPKDKSKVSVIIDKQIKYFFYLPLLTEIFPDAKYIILVRDVRDNIISKSNRKLNNSTNALYLASLWKNTYSQLNYLKNKNKSLLIIKYEDLVHETEQTLKTLCEFVQIPYSHEMIETDNKYQMFLDLRKSTADQNEIKRLESFQSNLLKPVHSSNIGSYIEFIERKTLAKIETHNEDLFELFRYQTTTSKATFNLKDYYQILKAFLYRPLLLRLYLRIPLPVKMVIKKLRR